jgi:hypothetical protein
LNQARALRRGHRHPGETSRSNTSSGLPGQFRRARHFCFRDNGGHAGTTGATKGRFAHPTRWCGYLRRYARSPGCRRRERWQ